MKIVTILGTRPEITKLSCLLPLLDREFEHVLVHTGQHYDCNMDSIFFEELKLRKPDYSLGIGSGSHAGQVAKMLVEIEKVLVKEKPDWVIVFADPNTPFAGAIVASKMGIPLIHLEAGCRSFNKKMPEEINRIFCDHSADLLIAPDEKAHMNLLAEGLSDDKIHVLGSYAIESSLRNVKFTKYDAIKEFVLLTVHRAENTNDFNVLKGLMEAVKEISDRVPVIFPMHPRTKKILVENGFSEEENFGLGKVKVIEPQGYLDFLNLLDNCLFVMSDSGGIQEEAAALNTPCLILRNETEWTYLVDSGKNLLVGVDKEKIVSTATKLINNPEEIKRIKSIPLNLNTNVSQKIIEVIKNESER